MAQQDRGTEKGTRYNQRWRRDQSSLPPDHALRGQIQDSWCLKFYRCLYHTFNYENRGSARILMNLSSAIMRRSLGSCGEDAAQLQNGVLRVTGTTFRRVCARAMAEPPAQKGREPQISAGLRLPLRTVMVSDMDLECLGRFLPASRMYVSGFARNGDFVWTLKTRGSGNLPFSSPELKNCAEMGGNYPFEFQTSMGVGENIGPFSYSPCFSCTISRHWNSRIRSWQCSELALDYEHPGFLPPCY